MFANEQKSIVLLGNPNVGKSVIFGLLTKKYVVVSNYPGTTVEFTCGKSVYGDKNTQIIDTPGTNSLVPQSEDERVARDIILNNKIQNLIQVVDAKNLDRGLSISIQLAEAEIPFMVVLNMDDEAKSRGIEINRQKLSKILGIDVISTVATQRKGIKELIGKMGSRTYSSFRTQYSEDIENAIKSISELMPESNISKRFLSIMLLSGDTSLKEFIAQKIEKSALEKIDSILSSTASKFNKPVSYVINQQRQKAVNETLAEVLVKENLEKGTFASWLGQVTMHPVWGGPILAGVMFLTYKIVGEFGAGTCVNFMEKTVFGLWVNPVLVKIFSVIPVAFIRELFVGEYGLLTMALTYAVAIVLPIVGFFFVIFGLLEDSGYLPRLAIMANKVFKVMGLNGKAVLPMVLGLGCDTMATMTARILPGNKERIIVTLLLALAVPCSAQLGVIFGGTASISGKATLIWMATIIFVILVVGFLASKVVPGKSPDFIQEIPPMRIPKLSNIVIKTLARMQWYLKEAVPLFMLGTLILFVLVKTGMIGVIENFCAPVVVNLLQLPKESASAFVMGFLRRDYAAVMLVKSGNLSSIQMLVSIVTITLFVPCIANTFVMIKERGLKVAAIITVFIFVFAFVFGGLFNFVLRFSGVEL